MVDGRRGRVNEWNQQKKRSRVQHIQTIWWNAIFTKISCVLWFFFLLCVFFFGFRFGVYYLNNMGEHISISKYRLYDSWHLRSASVYIKRIDECHQHQSLPKFIFTLSFLPLQLFVELQLSIMMVTMFFLCLWIHMIKIRLLLIHKHLHFTSLTRW